MYRYKKAFDQLLGVKSAPNEHEISLFSRAQKYIRFVSWIPGIEMIAIVNSLSMYATHQDSDIDLFIVTKPGYMWFVRVCVTGIFSLFGVWRKGEDIAGNFCLSFFVTTEAMDLQEIAIEDDIYLYYWLYYMKPVFFRGDIYARFLSQNDWVQVDTVQKTQNLQFSRASSVRSDIFSPIWRLFDRLFRLILEPKTIAQYDRLGRPPGVIISRNMLKFHDKDRREEVRDSILKKQSK